MKDIFIDNNLAKNFATPLDPNYKTLIKWLFAYDAEDVKNNPENIENYAHLVVNQKLLSEYNRSSRGCAKSTAITTIISRLTIQGRLIKVSKSEIELFNRQYITKKVTSSLNSNAEDHVHIPTVLLSVRKMALTYDVNLAADLLKVPGFNPIVKARPEELNYV